MLRHFGLFKNSSLCRIHTGSNVILEHFQRIVAQSRAVANRRKRVIIRHHQKTFIFLRQIDKRFERTEIIADMQLLRRRLKPGKEAWFLSHIESVAEMQEVW